MPSPQENFLRTLPVGASVEFDIETLIEDVQHRELNQLEKIWIDLTLFNEIYTLVGHQTQNIAAMRDLFTQQASEKTLDNIMRIYLTYANKFIVEAPGNQKLAKSFRFFATLQNFEDKYNKDWLDKIYFCSLTKGDRYQLRKVKSIVTSLLRYISLNANGVLAIDRVASTPEALKQAQIEILTFLRKLEIRRGEGKIIWKQY